ncbi:MAG: sugar phosphate isomerase/epimerase [Lachnospiraceae bacterium]|nr:sugar phosphate isomerase/epimerase [Lachnospiraceae bacterium]
MIRGCCIDLSWYDKLVEYGYESIALAAKDVAAWDEETFSKNKEKLSKGPLKTISLNSFCTQDLRLDGSGYDPEKLRAYMERLCPRAAALGFSVIGIGAPASRNLGAEDDRETCLAQFKESLRIMCDVAAAHGIGILLESVCSLECNFITTTREAYAIVKELALPNLHLVYDIYHEVMEGQPVDVIDEVINEIRVVHIAQDENGKRAWPDKAHIDEYRVYWDRLHALGYTGEWNPECFTGDIDQGLQQSIQILKSFS